MSGRGMNPGTSQRSRRKRAGQPEESLREAAERDQLADQSQEDEMMTMATIVVLKDGRVLVGQASLVGREEMPKQAHGTMRK